VGGMSVVVILKSVGSAPPDWYVSAFPVLRAEAVRHQTPRLEHRAESKRVCLAFPIHLGSHPGRHAGWAVAAGGHTCGSLRTLLGAFPAHVTQGILGSEAHCPSPRAVPLALCCTNGVAMVAPSAAARGKAFSLSTAMTDTSTSLTELSSDVSLKPGLGLISPMFRRHPSSGKMQKKNRVIRDAHCCGDRDNDDISSRSAWHHTQ